MPKHKDLKRLVRSRMQKTGESYTAARAQLVARKSQPAKTPTASKPDYAALAGMKDATIEARTGCTWEKWVGALDYHEASKLSHREIAQIVHQKFGVGEWWAQSVTVGYERIKGLREIGQRRAGHYDVNRSRTLPVAVAVLYAACADARQRRRWLPGAKLTVRKATPARSMRVTWDDGTSVELWFEAKGAGKSSVHVQHVRLPSKAEADARRAFWGERLDALAALLSPAQR
ncbi:MAG: hypothetical protein KJ067_10575 [Vicinamibacteria bacterium]|jgi:uncharacterized protein YndB with AHSA1/START domain|nr:hypothetical protein [Vicinamibacteria bacterium]